MRRKLGKPVSMFEFVFNQFAQLSGLDSDRDGVKDHLDCRPFNPFMHATGYIYDEQGNVIKKGELKKIAKEHFGLTHEPREAGYILPSGEMLDFTGRHQATGYNKRKPTKEDYLRNKRNLDHRDIGQVMKKGGTDAMIKFQAEEGAIRFSKFDDGDLHIDIVKKPTPEQIKAMVMSMIIPPRGDYLLIEKTSERGIVEDPTHERLESNRPHPILIQKFISKAFKKKK